MRQAPPLLPRHDHAARLGGDQCAGARRQLEGGGKKCLDAPGAVWPQTWNRGPPLLAPRIRTVRSASVRISAAAIGLTEQTGGNLSSKQLTGSLPKQSHHSSQQFEAMKTRSNLSTRRRKAASTASTAGMVSLIMSTAGQRTIGAHWSTA